MQRTLTAAVARNRQMGGAGLRPRDRAVTAVQLRSMGRRLRPMARPARKERAAMLALPMARVRTRLRRTAMRPTARHNETLTARRRAVLTVRPRAVRAVRAAPARIR